MHRMKMLGRPLCSPLKESILFRAARETSEEHHQVLDDVRRGPEKQNESGATALDDAGR